MAGFFIHYYPIGCLECVSLDYLYSYSTQGCTLKLHDLKVSSQSMFFPAFFALNFRDEKKIIETLYREGGDIGLFITLVPKVL